MGRQNQKQFLYCTQFSPRALKLAPGAKILESMYPGFLTS
ncbi:hypothetical protein A2U01_0102527, partial [Trifolium medium]|nr:hypothetical protein [Trifolium medium]